MTTSTSLDVPVDAKYHLLGTYTRYSSWTARIEAVLEYFKIPYTSTYVSLPEVKTVSPTGLVPIFQVPSLGPSFYINESLSICEFLAESHPDLPLWPKDRQLRALARSAASEMHSGFSELRSYDTNFIAKYTGNIPITESGRKDISRVLELWGGARKKTAARLAELGEDDEGFLFGGFGIVDAFFWPVLWRFRTYSLPLEGASPETISWIRKMWRDPVLKALVKNYFRQAGRPETKVEKYDKKYDGYPDIVIGTFDEDWEFSV